MATTALNSAGHRSRSTVPVVRNVMWFFIAIVTIGFFGYFIFLNNIR